MLRNPVSSWQIKGITWDLSKKPDFCTDGLGGAFFANQSRQPAARTQVYIGFALGTLPDTGDANPQQVGALAMGTAVRLSHSSRLNPYKVGDRGEVMAWPRMPGLMA
jgi:hypothetical protein